MNTLSGLVLAFMYLVGININLPFTSELKSNLVETLPARSLVRPQEHKGMTQPVMVGTEILTLAAKSAYVWDVTSATPLFAQNADQPLPIASITKIITAAVILDSHGLEEIVTIPTLPGYKPEDSTLGLVPGQRFYLKDLLQAALIPSANDAADALAIYDSGTITAFAAKMNRYAQKWGIEDVRFTNPSGLSDRDNFATSEALAKLAKLALLNTNFANLVTRQNGMIIDSNGQAYSLKTTNRLLIDARVKGVKTGYTEAAGQSFVSLAEIKGRQVITVVLNSPDRFAETQKMLNWVENNIKWY